MDIVTEKRLEIAREKAELQGTFGDYFSTEWAGNDDGNRMLDAAKRLFMIDTHDTQALQEAHATFLLAVIDASSVSFEEAEDALEAYRAPLHNASDDKERHAA